MNPESCAFFCGSVQRGRDGGAYACARLDSRGRREGRGWSSACSLAAAPGPGEAGALPRANRWATSRSGARNTGQMPALCLQVHTELAPPKILR